MSNSKTDATASSVGYIYQLQYSLIYLLGKKDSNLYIKIETYDDISVHDIKTDKIVALLQTKHYKSSNLTDKDTQFWKTLYNWINSSSEEYDDTEYFLATTSTIKENSFFQYLTQNKKIRDISQAKKELDNFVGAQDLTSNSDINKYIKAYEEQSDEDKIKLLNKITILSDSIRSDQIIDSLIDTLRYAFSDKNNKDLSNTLLTWWQGECTKNLNDSEDKQQLSLQYVENKLIQLRHQDTYTITLKPHNNPALFENSIFIKQMEFIDLDKDQTDQEILHFATALNSRTEWVKQAINMSNYDKKLQSLYRDNLLVCPNNPCEITQGRHLFVSCMNGYKEYNTMIGLRQSDQDQLFRGSLHMLSDNKKIGWHPKYKDLL